MMRFPLWKRLVAVMVILAVTAACNKDEHVKPAPKPDPDKGIVYPSGDYNIVGAVTCDDKGIPGVSVSDGTIVVRTDSKGVFAFKSGKKTGYVFISIPSGYNVENKGVLPQFYANVTSGKKDTAVFKLTKASQDNYSVFLLGDMHLANKRNDIAQFSKFAYDLNTLRSQMNGKCFAITLGDMAWDAYWDGFDLKDYVNEMTRDFPSLTVFHTIGNHDHELGNGTEGDELTVKTYRRVIGPNYYSFNVGKVHYVVLDDILCRNTIDGTRASWNEMTDEQMQWLSKDLSFVGKDTPIVVTAHAPLYRNDGKFNLYNGWDLLKCFTGYKNVYFFSGHTHVVYNVDWLKSSTNPVYESNSGAVCGAWWYTVYDFPKENVHISSDGAPGGYRVLNVNGNVLDWYYKGTGCDSDYRLRAYDRNRIKLDPDLYVPDATSENRQGFIALAGDYVNASSANEVIINVWDYDPSWTVSVTETDGAYAGKKLQVKQISGLDPLYLASSEAYSFNKGYTTKYDGSTISSYYPAAQTSHLFSVTASSPATTLRITATDRFGHSVTRTMTRPKDFRIEY